MPVWARGTTPFPISVWIDGQTLEVVNEFKYCRGTQLGTLAACFFAVYSREKKWNHAGDFFCIRGLLEALIPVITDPKDGQKSQNK